MLFDLHLVCKLDNREVLYWTFYWHRNISTALHVEPRRIRTPQTRTPRIHRTRALRTHKALCPTSIHPPLTRSSKFTSWDEMLRTKFAKQFQMGRLFIGHPFESIFSYTESHRISERRRETENLQITKRWLLVCRRSRSLWDARTLSRSSWMYEGSISISSAFQMES